MYPTVVTKVNERISMVFSGATRELRGKLFHIPVCSGY